MALQGMKELRAQIRGLNKEFGQPVLRRAVRAGGAVLRAGARREVPRSLQKEIVSRESRGETKGEAVVTIGFRKGKGARGFLLRFREQGTRPHLIAATGSAYLDRKTRQQRFTRKSGQGKKALAIRFGGLTLFRKQVSHPGQRARPFLRQAFVTQKDAAIEAVARVYREAVEKVRGLR